MRPPKRELAISFEEKSTTYAASMALHEGHHYRLRRRHYRHHRHHRHHHRLAVLAVVLVRLWTYARFCFL